MPKQCCQSNIWAVAKPTVDCQLRGALLLYNVGGYDTAWYEYGIPTGYNTFALPRFPKFPRRDEGRKLSTQQACKPEQ